MSSGAPESRQQKQGRESADQEGAVDEEYAVAFFEEHEDVGGAFGGKDEGEVLVSTALDRLALGPCTAPCLREPVLRVIMYRQLILFEVLRELSSQH